MAFSVACLSLTSNSSAITFTENFCSSSFFNSVNLAALLPVIQRSYPCCANSVAIALPKPEVAPVTSIVLFIIEFDNGSKDKAIKKEACSKTYFF
jgi:hypothetical protein